jgi:hypothetical protein
MGGSGYGEGKDTPASAPRAGTLTRDDEAAMNRLDVWKVGMVLA